MADLSSGQWVLLIGVGWPASSLAFGGLWWAAATAFARSARRAHR